MTAALTPHQEREVAVRAGCDPRSVRAHLAGKPQRSTTASRIRQALTELGYESTSPPRERR